jgi:4-hydroxybenzoate polyprenyltransferase
MERVLHSTRVTLEMIKWEHSIFALPFALTAAVLAANGMPSAWVLLWIIVCMVSARSAAMAFNRLVDAEIDARNPRTAMRALPAGDLSRGFVLMFTVISVAVFILGTAMLNRLTLLLSPVALAVVLLYSYTKRFTRWSHLFLGLSYFVAPAAAWIAVRGSLDPRILVLAGAGLFWVSGFDVLYACQDFEYDTRAGLHSIPQAFGVNAAFWIARGMHLLTAVLLFVFAHLFGLGPVALVGIGLVVVLLAYEHAIVSPTDMRRLNAAFFTLNGIISVVFFLFVAADVLHRR